MTVPSPPPLPPTHRDGSRTWQAPRYVPLELTAPYPPEVSDSWARVHSRKHAQGIGTCHKHASPYYQDAARRAEQKRREATLRAELVYEGEMVDIRRLENRQARVAAPQGEGNTDE